MSDTTGGLPDSGHRENFSTGSMREMAPGKGRFDLISPVALRRLAVLLEKGAEKYEPRNWQLGLPLHSFVDSGMRHLAMMMEGDESEDHAAAALWNMMGLVHTMELVERGDLPAELDDLGREFFTRAAPRSEWDAIREGATDQGGPDA